MLLKKISLFLKWSIMQIEFWIWLRKHSGQDLEQRLIELGCTAVHTRNSTIFTTPNGLGKIEVADEWINVNPK